MTLKYSPVDSGKFRLLTIYPRDPLALNASQDNSQPARISTSLSIELLDNPPEYYALSYTWGDATDTITILVGACEHQVTRNLGLALEHMQHESDAVVLWADALCIDQNNIDERDKQVSRMTDIYCSAKLTIVWLGVPELGASFVQQFNEIGSNLLRLKIRVDDVDRTFDELMTEIGTVSMGADGHSKSYDDLEKMKNDWEALNEIFANSMKDIPLAMALITGYDSLMNQSYWSRVWIQQEFLVSTNIVLQWDDSAVTFSQFRATMLYCHLLRGKLATELLSKIPKLTEGISEATSGKLLEWFEKGCPSGFMEDDANEQLSNLKTAMKSYSYFTATKAPSNAIFGARHQYQKDHKKDSKNGAIQNSTLIRLLASVFVDKNTNSGDPRDRIFAMLGMANDRKELEKLGLKLQYKGTTDIAIYINAARAMIASGHVDLLSLSQHQHGQDKRKPRYVPSWVPGLFKPMVCTFSSVVYKSLVLSTLSRPELIPSWVPDWLHPIVRPRGQVWWQSFFDASKDMPFESAPGSAIASDSEIASGTKIDLKGWEVDTIEGMKPSWIKPDALYSDNLVNNLQYLIDINNLYPISQEKIRISGKDIYLEGSTDLQTSLSRIPIADQELLATGFIRQANDEIRAVHNSMAKIRGEITPEQALYVEQMKVNRFRRPFFSKLGYIGLVPDHAKNRDILVIFRGGKFPYVLRQNRDETYKFVGEAYVHGIMYGQYFQVPGEKKEVTFTLS